MDGKNNFMGKVMCVFMDMDKMVGGDFEKGLASLGEVTTKDAERAAARDAAEAAAAAAESAGKK